MIDYFKLNLFCYIDCWVFNSKYRLRYSAYEIIYNRKNLIVMVVEYFVHSLPAKEAKNERGW